MSQHRKNTRLGPGLISIATGWMLTAMGSAGTGYVISSPGWSGREVVAALLGMSLTGTLVAHSMDLTVSRVVVQNRVRDIDEMDRANRLRQERVRDRYEQLWSTGQDPSLNSPWRTGEDPAPISPPLYPESDVTHLIPAYRDEMDQVVDQAVTRYLDEEMDPNGYPISPPLYPNPSTFPGFVPAGQERLLS